MLSCTLSRQALAACLLLILCCVVTAAQQGSPGNPPKPDSRADKKPGAKPEVSPTAQGQSPAQPQKKGDELKEGATILKEQTEVVSVTVTVTDPYNRLVTGLDKQHFEVYEDKVKQSIEYFKDEDAPASIGIIFDVSGSMKSKLPRSRDALKAFIQTCHDDDDFFLVTFNQQASLVAEFTDGNTLLGKLSLIEGHGQTAVYDAAYLGVEKVQQGRHPKRALLLISDGQDNSSRYTFNELRKILKEANVQIYCIGIVEEGGAAGGTLDLQGQSILEEIAQVTGGKAFFPRSAAELEDATTRIALELRHQYSLGYIPTNVKRDGLWHKIKVHLNPPRGLPHLTVRAKEGYYALPK